MRPIDADALKKWAEEYHASNWGIPQDELIYAIGSAPTIEPKRGKWITEPNCWYRCSNCGQHYPSIRGYMDYNYCPNCGAKMDVADNDVGKMDEVEDEHTD